MSEERDAGLAALQNGNAAEAIPYLERAANDAPNDLQTLLYLGAAYGQTGRHSDAVRTVMQAVTLQPANAAARYHLAVAYANAGHTEYALTAAQQALHLQPDDPKAQELVARLSGAPAAPNNPPPPSPGQPAAYGQPAAPSPYGQAQPPVGQSQAPYGRPEPTASPMQPTVGGYAPGQTAPPYGAPGAAPYPQQPAGGSYQGQGAAAYGGSPPATYYSPPPRPGVVQVPDTFDMKQAALDWVRVIREPHAFFREQADREGSNAPIAFLVTFGIGVGVLQIVSVLIRMALEPPNVASAIGQMVGGVIGGIIGALVGAFLWGGVLHIIGRLFGNRRPYHKSFRVAAYARAPLLIFSLFTALLTPFLLPASALTPRSTGTPSPFGQLTPVQFTQPRSSTGFPDGQTYGAPGGTTRTRTSTPNPFEDPSFQKVIRAYGVIGSISLIGLIWVWCLQAIGLRYAQDLSPGSAAGTVFLSLLIPFLLLIVCGFLFGALFAAVFASARGGPGFESALSMVPSGLAVWRGL